MNDDNDDVGFGVGVGIAAVRSRLWTMLTRHQKREPVSAAMRSSVFDPGTQSRAHIEYFAAVMENQPFYFPSNDLTLRVPFAKRCAQHGVVGADDPFVLLSTIGFWPADGGHAAAHALTSYGVLNATNVVDPKLDIEFAQAFVRRFPNTARPDTARIMQSCCFMFSASPAVRRQPHDLQHRHDQHK